MTGESQLTFSRISLGSAAVLLVIGCGSERASVPSVSVRDSAGTTIVENRGIVRADGGGWSIGAEPRVSIGSADGPETTQLYRVRGALRLPDGRIAVGNDGSREIKIFGAGGTHLKSVGGEGEGPGEFRSVMLAGRSVDSLVALDRRLRRVSLVHPDDGFARSFSLADPVAAYPLRGWFFESGAVLIRDLPLEDSDIFSEGLQRAPIPFRSCDMSGALRADFGTFAGAEQITVNRQTDAGLASYLLDVPFGKSPQIAVAGDQLFVGAQEAFEIRVFESGGALKRIVRLERAPVPVADADLSAYIDAEVAGTADEAAALSRRQDLERMPRVEFRPAHGAVHADAAGFLFVEDFRWPAGAAAVVNVFDPEGKLVGRFELPTGIQVLEIGSDYLLGLYRDALEIEYLHLYDLHRPAS